MSPGEKLSAHILTAVRVFDFEDEIPLAATMASLTSCLLVTINRCPDEQTKARLVVSTMQALLEFVEVDRSLLPQAVKEMAMFDVEGTA